MLTHKRKKVLEKIHLKKQDRAARQERQEKKRTEKKQEEEYKKQAQLEAAAAAAANEKKENNRKKEKKETSRLRNWYIRNGRVCGDVPTAPYESVFTFREINPQSFDAETHILTYHDDGYRMQLQLAPEDRDSFFASRQDGYRMLLLLLEQRKGRERTLVPSSATS